MPRSPKASPLPDILTALRALPAPLKTHEEGEALRDAVSRIQDLPSGASTRAFAADATAELARVLNATLDSRRAKDFEHEILFALKILACLGTRPGVEVIIAAAKKPFRPDSYMWSVVLGVFGQGHPGAEMLFAALSTPIVEKFLGISLLDAANEACREHGVKKHPFDSAKGQARLAAILGSTSSRAGSYAISACAALPYLSARRRAPLVKLARKHKAPAIRMEVAWATAMLGDKTGLDYLVEKCLDVSLSRQARTYLKELKQKSLIPREARDPDFTAMAEMADWLAHPNEFGEPPDRISLFDTRKIFWPPTNDTRKVRLFRYEYDKSKDRPKKEVGLGMVGSVTFALFGETTTDKTPEQAYGLHCEWELEMNEDSRAPKKRTGKQGWKLIERGK